MNILIEKLLTKLHKEIPVTAHMGINIESYDGKTLVLTSPVALNINDKSTAFGGSLYSLAVLAGWGLLYLKTLQKEIVADIAIYKSSTTFKRAAKSDLRAVCQASGKIFDELFTNFQTFNKAKISLETIVYSAEKLAVKFTGQYVLLPSTVSKTKL